MPMPTITSSPSTGLLPIQAQGIKRLLRIGQLTGCPCPGEHYGAASTQAVTNDLSDLC